MTQLINMTPHTINVVDKDGVNLQSIPASGNQIRLSMTTVQTEWSVNGITITKTVYGEPTGLPEYSQGIYYIVSAIVKSALSFRTDLLVPAEMVRNESGQIVGCMSLGQ